MTTRIRLQKGDRVRAKVPTMCGWKGTGTVSDISGHLVEVLIDGSDDKALPHECFAWLMDYQVAKMRPAHDR